MQLIAADTVECKEEVAVAHVTILGTGRMGTAMARKLVEAGNDVTVWNRTAGKAEELARVCAVRVAPTSADAVSGADIVLCVFASGAVTESVILDPEVLAAARAGVIFCDMGTSGVATAKVLEASLTNAGHRFIDSPVSGSVPAVETGQLLVMASGQKSSVDQAAPVLAAFAKKVVYVGESGAGQVMKLAVNLIVHSLNSAVSEALTLATSAGIDRGAAYDVFQDSSIAAPYVLYKRSAFLGETQVVAMSLDLVLKDLGLILALAEGERVPVRTAIAVRDEIAVACEAGFGSSDMAALAIFLQQNSH